MQEAKVATVSAEHDPGTMIGAAGRVVCFNAYTDQTRMWQASYLLMPGNTTIDQPVSKVHTGHATIKATFPEQPIMDQAVMDIALPLLPMKITMITLSLGIHGYHLYPATLGPKITRYF